MCPVKGPELFVSGVGSLSLPVEDDIRSLLLHQSQDEHQLAAQATAEQTQQRSWQLDAALLFATNPGNKDASEYLHILTIYRMKHADMLDVSAQSGIAGFAILHKAAAGSLALLIQQAWRPGCRQPL